MYKESADEVENPIDLKSKVEHYRPFRYEFGEYMCALFTWLCCSCICKEMWRRGRKQRFDKYNEACKRMQQEFDFLELTRRIRILSMLSNALFAKRQSIFVGFAGHFCIHLHKS